MIDALPAPEAVIDGIPAYAPSLGHGPDGFDAAAFDELAELEPSSFWFRSRNELIKWAARTYFPSASSIHEIGCGTGFVLSGLQEVYPTAQLSGSEPFIEGLRHARRRAPELSFVQMDARDIPFREAFDLVGAFDVLEHIDDDVRVLEQVHGALRPGGGLLLTVPQHPSLWSVQDVAAHHQRRYDRRSLVGKLSAAGFEAVRTTSFVSLLLPLMVVQRRLLDRGRTEGAVEAVRAPFWIDRALRPVMAFERTLIRMGADLPLGGSLLVVAVRRT